ncbi:arginine--tRNA ligase [Acuticoccus mangrovi]|uniref:Arginine--tRNA ligase n=1 Tax=Acuticoccus mangrovi TaxID=2796142 RepID=A0A934IRU9_9HYPH|nr:arginine--tRNA ligase [Acuticoccus mangrovi]MBJ3776514.1 arginine--tRNA ligase [Acuticoccus mangrovi]
MHLFETLKQRVTTIAQGEGLSVGLDRIAVETPRDPTHGDLATNAAMVLAKPAKRNPRELGEIIAARLVEDPLVAGASVAGPGFVNITIAPEAGAKVVKAALDGAAFTRLAETDAPQKVNVEYVSANPTGPLHVGHARGAVVGDALANVLALRGHAVTREYYINDAGSQVDALARSAFLRYREALGETIEIPSGLYPGDYLVPVGEALAREHGEALRDMAEEAWLPIVREVSIAAMMAAVREDLDVLQIRHEVFFSERSLQVPTDIVAATIQRLEGEGLIYQGVLPRPKGQADDWEDREQTLFRSTQYGDDIDRALKKSDGSYTYFASDIAYHDDKIQRGFDRLIDVLGADHGGYVKRMTAAVAALSHEKVQLDCLLCQLVKLYRAGEPVKMSKRAGDFVTLRDVVDEVGADPVRFMMLYRKSDAPLDFDFAKVTEQSRDNPVFYVQYAHARCASAKRQAVEALGADVLDDLSEAAAEQLVDAGEKALIILLAQWPQVLAAAADSAEPHRVAFYLHELASALHTQWNRGKDDTALRFVNAEARDLTRARLALVEAVQAVLRTGLSALGVSAPSEMR